MSGRKRLERSVALVGGGLGAAMAIARELRAELLAGRCLAGLLSMLDEMDEALLDLESAVGAQTPAALFGLSWRER